MSFGGATAAEVCHLDERCKAAINLDGGHMFGVDSELRDGDISRPLLMLHSSDIVTHPTPSDGNPGDYQAYSDFHYEPIATRGSRDDVVRLRIDGTSHLHISDGSLMVRWIPGIASRTPGPRIAEILNRYCLAFFDEHLLGRPAPLLDGPSAQYPEVTFQTFGREPRRRRCRTLCSGRPPETASKRSRPPNNGRGRARPLRKTAVSRTFVAAGPPCRPSFLRQPLRAGRRSGLSTEPAQSLACVLVVGIELGRSLVALDRQLLVAPRQVGLAEAVVRTLPTSG